MVKQNHTENSKKILLLEDETVLGQLYVEMLEEEGYLVEWFLSTERFVEKAAAFSPDLILLDNTIRGEERAGVDLVTQLKEILPKAPIIILSNYDLFQFEKELESIEKLSYLLKIDNPPSVLIQHVQRALAS